MIKIYVGKRKYRQVFPKKLKRGVTLLQLSRTENYFILKGEYPTDDSTTVVLENMSDNRKERFSLQGNRTWEGNLSESVSLQYKFAIVILEER